MLDYILFTSLQAYRMSTYFCLWLPQNYRKGMEFGVFNYQWLLEKVISWFIPCVYLLEESAEMTRFGATFAEFHSSGVRQIFENGWNWWPLGKVVKTLSLDSFQTVFSLGHIYDTMLPGPGRVRCCFLFTEDSLAKKGSVMVILFLYTAMDNVFSG